MSIKELYEQLAINIDDFLNNDHEKIERALSEISAKTKSRSDISDLYDCDGYTRLHSILSSQNVKFTPIVLSILANCCTTQNWRERVRDGGCLQMAADILVSTVQIEVISSAARLLANLAKDASSLPLLQEKPIIESLISKCSLSHIKCLLSCLRALKKICTNKKSARMAIECKKFQELVMLLNETAVPEVILAYLQMLCDILKNRLPEVCHRIMECEILIKLCEFCRHTDVDIQSKSYEILFLLSLNSNCRVTVAMDGGLDIFAERIQTLDNDDTFKFAIQCICLFAREAVSRNKMKTAGTLPFLAKILDDENFISYHESIVAACVMFIFDDLSLGIMIKAGLIRAMLKYLDRLTGIEFKKHLESTKNQPDIEPDVIQVPDHGLESNESESSVPPEIQHTDNNFDLSILQNEDVSNERQNCWSNSSPETSPYHAYSPPYYQQPPLSPGYSPQHSPYSHQISYSPPHSPPYSPNSPPYSPSSPRRSIWSPQSQQYHTSPKYSPQHSPPHLDDVYSDPLNDSTCSNEQVPYHHQSADGLYAMIHGTRGPVHDTLLLLSRFSQATDPSSFFLVLPEFNHILNYLLLSTNPKPKCARIMNRLAQNSHCFDVMLKGKLIPRLYLRLSTGWSLEHLVMLYEDAKSKHVSSDPIPASDDCNKNIENNLYKWKLPSKETLSLECLLLSNIRCQCDSSYGRGVLTHILLTGSQKLKETLAVSLPHIVRSTRLKQRVFWELKGAQILMDMLSEFPDISSEMFVLNVEAVSVLANLIGLTCAKLPESERSVCLKFQSDEESDGVESAAIKTDAMELDTIEPPSKKRRIEKQEQKEPVKLIVFELPSGKTVSCASSQLVKYSRVFERMLSHSYIDSSKTCIKISDINENAFIKLIHYLCGCELKLDDSLNCNGVCMYNLMYGGVETECAPLIGEGKKGKESITECTKIAVTNLMYGGAQTECAAMVEEDKSINEPESTRIAVTNLMYGGVQTECASIIEEDKAIDESESTTVYGSVQTECATMIGEDKSINEPESTTVSKDINNPTEIIDVCGETVDIHNISMQLAPSLMCVMDLLSCSERFFVEKLKSKCENFLMNSTTNENVVDLFFLSSLHNSFLLKKYTLDYLLTSIECPMLRTKSFAEILYSNEKDSFLQFLRSEILCRP